MQDFIRPDPSFTPRELFARMQGAWFEPRTGYMYAIPTGKSAITTGGQTVGAVVDLSQQPAFGPELIINGGPGTDTSGWTAQNAAGLAAVNGKLRISTTTIDYGFANQGFTTNIGQTYYVTATVSGNEAYCIITNQSASFTPEIKRLYTYPDTNGTYFTTFVATATTTYIALLCGIVGASPIDVSNISVRQVISGAVRLAVQATAANRPTYQLNGNLPLIRHADSTDVLTATLPAINVRRNLLTYSEDFTNAAWTKSLLSVTQLGGSISRVTPSGNGFHNLQAGGAVAATQTLQVIAKYNGYHLWLQLHSTNGSTAFFDLQNGTVSNNSSFPATFGSGATQVAKSITPLVDGWYLCTLSAILPSSGNAIIGIARDSLTYSYTADGISGIYIRGAQLELGSVATDYQKITDWTSEAYSSSGSTYFSTPVGMSCLHNQSIGTSYNLPALQTDIYGTVITPARLAPPLEKRLELYMLRLAGLIEPDYLLDDNNQQLTDDSGELLLRA